MLQVAASQHNQKTWNVLGQQVTERDNQDSSSGLARSTASERDSARLLFKAACTDETDCPNYAAHIAQIAPANADVAASVMPVITR